MTSRTRMRWRNAAGSGAVCLLVAAFAGGARNWAQITAAEEPRRVRVVGSYPPVFGWSRPLLAAPGTGPVRPGEPCAMAVYVRTGQNRYQPYTLEGGP